MFLVWCYRAIFWCGATEQFPGIELQISFLVRCYRAISWCGATEQLPGIELQISFLVRRYRAMSWCGATEQFPGVVLQSSFLVRCYRAFVRDCTVIVLCPGSGSVRVLQGGLQLGRHCLTHCLRWQQHKVLPTLNTRLQNPPNSDSHCLSD